MKKTYFSYWQPRKNSEIDTYVDKSIYKIYDGVAGIYKLSFPLAKNYFSEYPIFIGKSIDIRNIILKHIREIKRIVENLDHNWFDSENEFSYLIDKDQFRNGIQLSKNSAQYQKIVFYLLYTDIDLNKMQVSLLERTENLNIDEVSRREEFHYKREKNKLTN